MKIDYINAFETYLDKVTSTYDAQGLIVGIFDKEKILYEKTMGYRNVEKQLPITKDTIFGIASITKSFTVIGLLQLVEKGLIDIDKPVSDYYENWRLPKEHTPTIKQLLSHTAGFFPQERFLMTDMAKGLGLSNNSEIAHDLVLPKVGIEAIIRRINQVTSYHGLPGENFSYSNYAYGIITDLVHRFSKRGSYIKSIKEDILVPLELHNTFFEFNRTKEEKNITMLYTPTELGIKTTDDYTNLGFVLLGGGALKSTFNDMMSYTRFYLNDGEVNGQEIISKESVIEMTTERHSYKEHQGYGYGLVTGHLEKIHYSGHSGGLTGVSSFFGFCKESGKGVVVLCNTDGVPATSIGLAALRLAHDQYPNYKITEYPEGLWSKQMVENTVGTYESEEGDSAIIEASKEGIKILIGNKELKCRVIHETLMIIENKMEENYCKILRQENGQSYAIYLGSRIIPRKNYRNCNNNINRFNVIDSV